MTQSKYDQYVHEYTRPDSTRYVVAERIGYREYHVPMTTQEQELYGGHTWVAASVGEIANRFGSWPTRRQALRRARYLFGEQKIDY